MNIAFLTSRFPYPPDRGDRLTVLNLLRVLSREHRVTLFSFLDGREPAEARAEVGRFCERIETVALPRWRSWAQAWLGLPFPVPSQVAFYRSATMERRVHALAAGDRFDVVFTHLIRMAPNVARLDHPARVLWLGDSLGMALGRSRAFEPAWKWPGIAWERARVDRYSARCSRNAVETWALSPADQADMLRIGCRDVVLVTHGVDERLFDVVRRPAPEPRIVFLGNLSVPHNIDAAQYAARELWPRLHAARPEARLVIAGADPVPAVRQLAAIEGVEVTGPIPDLRTLWEGAHVMLAPLRFSTGIQNKVLEAMAAGVPVVATPQVAEGIEVRDGEHLLVAADEDGLVAATLETLGDPDAAAERVRCARDHVRAHFSWLTAVRRLEHVAASHPVRVAAGGTAVR